jgi:hypothetical protein
MYVDNKMMVSHMNKSLAQQKRNNLKGKSQRKLLVETINS